jgi:hypothetical protein
VRQTVILSCADFMESSCNDFQIKKLLESCFVVCVFCRESLWNINRFNVPNMVPFITVYSCL